MTENHSETKYSDYLTATPKQNTETAEEQGKYNGIAIEHKPSLKKSKKAVKKTTKLSSEEYIKLLEEKIQLITFVNGLQLPEISEGLTKSGRELLLALSKDHQSMIDKYVGLIQNM